MPQNGDSSSARSTRDATSTVRSTASLPVAPLEGHTVLVTGGAGFIGSHLVDAINEHATVRVLDDLSTGRRERVPEDAELIEADLRDPDALDRATAGVDVIFHQAALVSVERSIEEPTRTHAINATATLELLERARREDARVVLASSAAVYGQPETVPIPESHPTLPTSPYGLSKLALDRYAQLYADLYGLETVALRYFNAYGPRQTGGDYSGVIDVFFEQALAGEPLTVEGDGSQTRDFVHVTDVVRANLLAAAADTTATGAAYNIGTGESITIRKLAELVRDVADADASIEHVDPRPGDIERSRADISAAREALGYEPSVSLTEGLEQLVTSRQ